MSTRNSYLNYYPPNTSIKDLHFISLVIFQNLITTFIYCFNSFCFCSSFAFRSGLHHNFLKLIVYEKRNCTEAPPMQIQFNVKKRGNANSPGRTERLCLSACACVCVCLSVRDSHSEGCVWCCISYLYSE